MATARAAAELDDAALVDVALQVHARAIMYGTQVLHDRAIECRTELLRRLQAAAPTSIAVDVQRDRVLVTGAGATLTLRDGSGYTPHRSPDATGAPIPPGAE